MIELEQARARLEELGIYQGSAILVSTPVGNSSKTPFENSPVSPHWAKRLLILIA